MFKGFFLFSDGGRNRARTCDPLLVSWKQGLSGVIREYQQLRLTPIFIAFRQVVQTSVCQALSGVLIPLEGKRREERGNFSIQNFPRF